MAYASPMKIANGLVLDFTVDNADTAADTFLGLNASGEVTKFASIPRSRVSGGGNLTEATSSVLTITGGSAAVLTSGLTIQVKQASGAQAGYLSSADWTTFNNKLGTSLTSAYVYVGNGSNVATGVAISGDITISNAGVVAIASGVIVNADINASAAIAVSKLAAVTASRVLGSDGSGFIQALDTATYPSLTELAYVKGVTNAIQTQLNNRLSVTLSSPTNGDVITYNGSAWVNSPSSTGVPTGGTTAQILRKIDNTNYNTEWHTLVAADITDVSSTAAELNKLSGVTTTAAQFNFLNTLSGNVQAQLAAKLSTSLTQNYMIVGDASNIAVPLATGTNGYVLTSVSGVPTWVSPGVGGTVTSVAASGGTTGMSFTGSPITTSGTLTLTGTLAIANGGTGLTALGTAGQLIKVNAGATALEYFTPAYLTTLTNASTTLTGFTDTRVLYNNGGLLAEYTISGTGNVAMTVSPVFTTPNIGVATGTASGNWFAASGATLTGNNSILGAGTYDLSLGTSGSRLDNFNVYADNAINVETLDTLITINSIDTGINSYNSKIEFLGGSYLNMTIGNPVSNNSAIQSSPTLLYLQSTDGAATSSISITKDNIILLPNSGAPTVGYVWTATDVDGSGEWAAATVAGSAWPLTGSATLTGNMSIDASASNFNITLGATNMVGTFNADAMTWGIGDLTNTVGGASITGGGSGMLLRDYSSSGIQMNVGGSLFYFDATGDISISTRYLGAEALLSKATNQLTLNGTGANNSVIINAASPATTDRTWTIPDLSGDMTFVGLTGTQTLTNKTLGTGTVFSVIPTINDGITFTFNPNGTVSGLNVGAHTTDPSSPVNGDIYYDSANNLLRARINSAWVSLGAAGGGIGGSTGATDNSILRADGTGGATLQNSAFFVDDTANITLGLASVTTGTDRYIYSEGNSANINIAIFPKGAGVLYLGGASGIYVGGSVDFVDGDIALSTAMNTTLRAPSISGNAFNVTVGAGSSSAANGNGGHYYIDYGRSHGTGLDGNIGLLTTSVANWQSMEGGVYLGNRAAAPTAGIANGVALFAEDSNSSSEFYVTPESGAKVNISGLFEPVTESGTSFTLNETHRNKIVICSNSGVVTVTVGTGKAAGWNCMLVATHATGTITLSASGTTLNGTTVTTAQFETLSILHYGSEAYLSKLG